MGHVQLNRSRDEWLRHPCDASWYSVRANLGGAYGESGKLSVLVAQGAYVYLFA